MSRKKRVGIKSNDPIRDITEIAGAEAKYVNTYVGIRRWYAVTANAKLYRVIQNNDGYLIYDYSDLIQTLESGRRSVKLYIGSVARCVSFDEMLSTAFGFHFDLPERKSKDKKDKDKDKIITLQGWAYLRAEIVRRLGHAVTAGHYEVAADRFVKDMRQNPLLTKISFAMLDEWKEIMRGQGLAINTVDFYMRTIRALYNRAVEEDRIPDARPFNRIRFRTERTKHRALTLEQLKAIKNYTSERENRQMARDVFMLSFYFRGMAPVDIYKLEKNNIKDGILTYRRSKTSQQLVMSVEKEAAEIIARYAAPENSYKLLQISSDSRVNDLLHEVGKEIGVPELSLYWARHTWATVAQRTNAPISLISQALGHTSEHTTRIYLAGIESTRVDKLNRNIIDAIV